MLRSGNLPAAARAFQSELRPSANKITIAVGLYCNEANVGRIVDSAKSSSELYLLPADLEGRSCYRVIWGLFDTRQAAESAKGSLPEQLRAGDAAAVAISRILR